MSEGETLALPVFGAAEKVCGNCKLWVRHSVDARGWVGNCRLQNDRGLFPPSAPICDYFHHKSGVTARPSPSIPRARPVRSVAPMIRKAGSTTATVDLGDLTTMTKDELMQVFLEASGLAEVALAPKWEGGTVRLQPADASLQAKEIPVESLFHKVVMVRDRLRVLEQKINGHPKLSDAEKVEFQQYVTRCYGSLTTFNVLFQHKSDQFVGQKGDEA